MLLWHAAGAPAAPTAQPATIPAIRGHGDISEMLHRSVDTSGTVTATTRDGFYLQDPQGDDDPMTPDGIFVYTRGLPPVPRVGDRVRLEAVVAAYSPAGAGGRRVSAPRTELHPLGAWTVLGPGNMVPTVPIVLPRSDDDVRRLNSMRVEVAGPLTVVDQQRLQSHGQLVVAAGGRIEVPTDRLPPGPAAQALAVANDARRLVVDVGSPAADPALLGLRVGDTLDGSIGVLDIDDASDTPRLHVTEPLRWLGHAPRPAEPPPVGGTLRIAAFNLDNAFTTYADGSTADGKSGQGCRLGASRARHNCRGPVDAVEGRRQRAKLLAALDGLDADVVALMEVQNDGMATVQGLVDALDARAARGTEDRSYAAVPLDPADAGSDAIQTALIYRPARVQPRGAPLRDPAGVHPRPPLAQTFVDRRSGAVFSVVAVHFKSKRCGDARHHDEATGADADQRDGQGCWNARRRAESQALLAFGAQVQAAAGSADLLLVGDFNAYAREDPIRLLTDAGQVDLLGRLPGLAYSYVYDGAAGRLDQALASPSLAAHVTGAAEWHIDADEPPFIDYRRARRQPACAACVPDLYAPTPYRASDHDPLVIGLDFGKPDPPARRPSPAGPAARARPTNPP